MRNVIMICSDDFLAQCVDTPYSVVCRVQLCADLCLAISVNGGVSKHKIHFSDINLGA